MLTGFKRGGYFSLLFIETSAYAVLFAINKFRLLLTVKNRKDLDFDDLWDNSALVTFSSLERLVASTHRALSMRAVLWPFLICPATRTSLFSHVWPHTVAMVSMVRSPSSEIFREEINPGHLLSVG
jgi:hypothetical protein